MWNGKRAVSLLAFLLLGAARAWALHWDVLDDSVAPFRSPTATVSFQNRLYVAAKKSATGDTVRLWSTVDGHVWTPVKDSAVAGIDIQSFTIDTDLYGFGVDDNGRRAVCAFDGTSWRRLDQGDLGAGDWYASAALNGELFGVSSGHLLWRATPSVAPGSWTSSLLPGTTTAFYHRLVPYHGYLFLSLGDNPTNMSDNIFATADGTHWDWIFPPVFPGVYHGGALVVHHDELYWDVSYGFMTTTVGDQGGSVAWQSEGFAGAITYEMFGDLYQFEEFSPLLRRYDGNSNYTVIDSSPPAFCNDGWIRPNAVADAGEVAILLPCDHAVVLKEWLHGVSLVPLPATALTYGQTNEPLLRFLVTVNYGETLKSLHVHNLGTALAGTDVVAARLGRYVPRDTGGLSPFVLTDLTPDPDGKGWSTPPDFQLPLTDQADLFVAVDIADHPTDCATVKLALSDPDLQWEKNGLYHVPAPLVGTSDPISAVAGAPPQAIPEVLVFPSPARDVVRFAYDLTDPSDVRIRVFDRTGALVGTIDDPGKSPGSGTVTAWNAGAVAPGTYFATVEITSAFSRRFFKRTIVIEH